MVEMVKKLGEYVDNLTGISGSLGVSIAYVGSNKEKCRE